MGKDTINNIGVEGELSYLDSELTRFYSSLERHTDYVRDLFVDGSSYPLNVCVRLSESSSLTLYNAEKHVLNFLKRKKAIVGDYLPPNPNTFEGDYCDTTTHDILLLTKRKLLESRGVESYTQFVDKYSSSLKDKQRLHIPSANTNPGHMYRKYGDEFIENSTYSIEI